MNKIISKLYLNSAWDQKIAEVISKPLIFLKIHPNIVTILGIFLGLTCAALFATCNLFYAKIGSIIFFFASCFDHVDGIVARKLNKTSTFGHYLDHIGVCITYIVLFIGIGIYCEKNFAMKLYYGYVPSICVFMIMSIRFYLERSLGANAIHQKNFLGFEHEDIIYIVIPITFLNKIDTFLYWSFIGTPIFLLITIIVFFVKLRKS